MKKLDQLEDQGKKKLHKEGQHEIEDADFLREMGIGCEDNGLQLTQLSERTANIDCQQGALAREFQVNIECYYKFESNIVNPSYTHEGSSIGTVDYNSYAQEKQAIQMNGVYEGGLELNPQNSNYTFQQETSAPPLTYNSYQQEHEMQSASKNDLEFNPESFYRFESNIENASKTHEENSTSSVNYNSYVQQEMQRQEVITSQGGTSYVLSQGGTSYRSLIAQVIAEAKSSTQNYGDFLSAPMTGTYRLAQ
ncbi:uncharacterized protein [Miscanthus floridulus]|uniref:uncharacterized protein n=1 Tax=Miscanthus floridulus TaxID=154761 RepID=UPI00345A31E9